MNYQMLLECYSAGTAINKQEAQLLDIELESQLASIKYSRTQGCIEIAPDHICKTAQVCKGSFWITCLAALLDKFRPAPLGSQKRSEKVLSELRKFGCLEAI